MPSPVPSAFSLASCCCPFQCPCPVSLSRSVDFPRELWPRACPQLPGPPFLRFCFPIGQACWLPGFPEAGFSWSRATSLTQPWRTARSPSFTATPVLVLPPLPRISFPITVLTSRPASSGSSCKRLSGQPSRSVPYSDPCTLGHGLLAS